MAAERAASGTKTGGATFRSITAAIVWWVWLLFAAANLIDLAVQGHDHFALLAAAILLMVTGVAYVTAQRPRVIVDDADLTIRNPVRDHVIPWPTVIRADLSDLLRLRVRDTTGDGSGERTISAWAVTYSRRRKFTAQAKSRRAELREGRGRAGLGGSMGGGFGMSGLRTAGQQRTDVQPRTDAGSAEAEAERAIRLINDRADAIADAADTATGTGPGADVRGIPDPATPRVRSTWNWPAIAALVIPALLLTIVALI